MSVAPHSDGLWGCCLAIASAVAAPARKRLLVLLDWYLPGYKAGGPIQTIANMVERFGDRFDFYVLTRDRDMGERRPYPGVERNVWHSVGKARVFYSRFLGWPTIARCVREVAPDAIYLNRFFSRLTLSVLGLRRLRLLPVCSLIVAARGEFSSGALQLKRQKKWLFLSLLARFLFRDVIWQASNELEAGDIRRSSARFGLDATRIVLASDLPAGPPDSGQSVRKPPKRPGEARFVFLSRVSRMKNLAFAVQVLGSLGGNITLDVVGVIDDAAYWSECQELMGRRPHLKVTYQGPVPHEQVQSTLAGFHFFILPTLGENFGHVIPEALAAGCPVVISNRTPWHNLQQHGAGWDLALDRELWRDVLQRCVDMDQQTYRAASAAARDYVIWWLQHPGLEEQTLNLLRSATCS